MKGKFQVFCSHFIMISQCNLLSEPEVHPTSFRMQKAICGVMLCKTQLCTGTILHPVHIYKTASLFFSTWSQQSWVKTSYFSFSISYTNTFSFRSNSCPLKLITRVPFLPIYYYTNFLSICVLKRPLIIFSINIVYHQFKDGKSKSCMLLFL